MRRHDAYRPVFVSQEHAAYKRNVVEHFPSLTSAHDRPSLLPAYYARSESRMQGSRNAWKDKLRIARIEFQASVSKIKKMAAEKLRKVQASSNVELSAMRRDLDTTTSVLRAQVADQQQISSDLADALVAAKVGPGGVGS